MSQATPIEPTMDDADANRQADAEMDAMKARLREDVVSWSAGRTAAPERIAVDAAPARPAPARPSRAKAAPAEPVKPPAAKAPFKMSYGGTTERDHIAHILRLNSAR